MRVNEEILNAMRKAFKEAGNQNLFSKKCGIHQDFISKCMNHKVKSICLKKWIKLYPLLLDHLGKKYDSMAPEYGEASLIVSYRTMSVSSRKTLLRVALQMAYADVTRRKILGGFITIK